MQFFSSFCLTLSNYLLSGIQSTQLFAKHCLACQIIHSSEEMALAVLIFSEGFEYSLMQILNRGLKKILQIGKEEELLRIVVGNFN